MKKVLLLSALAIFALSACKEKSIVVAKVGGTEITDKMLAEKLQNTPPAYQNYVNTVLGRKQFIEAIVRETIRIEAFVRFCNRWTFRRTDNDMACLLSVFSGPGLHRPVKWGIEKAA